MSWALSCGMGHRKGRLGEMKREKKKDLAVFSKAPLNRRKIIIYYIIYINAHLDCIYLVIQYKSSFGVVGEIIGSRNINKF